MGSFLRKGYIVRRYRTLPKSIKPAAIAIIMLIGTQMAILKIDFRPVKD
jgi:hypothetical protein